MGARRHRTIVSRVNNKRNCCVRTIEGSESWNTNSVKGVPYVAEGVEEQKPYNKKGNSKTMMLPPSLQLMHLLGTKLLQTKTEVDMSAALVWGS